MSKHNVQHVMILFGMNCEKLNCILFNFRIYIIVLHTTLNCYGVILSAEGNKKQATLLKNYAKLFCSSCCSCYSKITLVYI